MNFINHCTDFEKSSENILADGESIFYYKDFPKVFNQLDQWIIENNIHFNSCLAVECENSVQSAIFLLFLLENGYNFFVLPKSIKGSGLIESEQIIPAFCRYRIIIGDILKNDKDAIFYPSRWLKLFANEKWHAIDQTTAVRGNLYLKTSGSTGIPKIAAIPHTGLQGNAVNTASRLLLVSTDRIALTVPVFHSFGLTTAFLSSIAVGASIDLQKRANLLRYLQREREFQPNVAFMTPIFCETLVKGRRSPRPYKLTIAAGDRFRGDTFSQYESLSGCLVNLYGSTEMGAIAAGGPSDPSELRSQSVGKPMQGVKIRIEERIEDVKDNLKGVGEVWCFHPFGFEGYIDDKGCFVEKDCDFKDGWFKIKDLGCIGHDGSVHIFGRSDHSINRDGILVFFADIEKAIGSIPGVESVVVISKGESVRGKGLTAFCVPVKGKNITTEMIRTSCFDLMNRSAVPDQIFLIESLPMLTNGKIDRQKLVKNIELIYHNPI